MLFILFLSQFVSAQEPRLEGVWRQPCQNQTLRSEDFQQAHVHLAEAYYADRECNVKVLEFGTSGNYVADGGEIDFTFQQITITAHNQHYVDDFNDRKVCGTPSWRTGEAQDVTGKSCEIFGPGLGIQAPPAGQMRFGIYKIEDAKLYFGKLTQEKDASAPEKRPAKFDPRYYLKD